MIAYPLPDKKIDRKILITHEMFHRLQKELWKGNPNYSIKHMENKQARILLKLEWNALIKALNSDDAGNKKEISDALIFNYYRKQLYSGADTMENRFELMEGLAEYTGVKICLQNDREMIKYTNDKKAYFWNLDSYTRSFGYLSGILYAALLDLSKADWRSKISTDSDLKALLQIRLKLTLPKNLMNEYEIIKTKYGFDTISSFEDQREIKIQKSIAVYKDKLIIKPHLTFKLINMKIGFNPTNLLSIDTLGTIFPNIQIIDDWGKLKVENGGCLLNSSWSTATINAENITLTEDTIKGNGWELKLNEKWKVINDGANFIIINYFNDAFKCILNIKN